MFTIYIHAYNTWNRSFKMIKVQISYAHNIYLGLKWSKFKYNTQNNDKGSVRSYTILPNMWF